MRSPAMRIYGAGLAGLLAATILRRYKPAIFEAQPSLPNNHNALLRFRSDAVSRATGIPFRKVTVTKAIWSEGIHTVPNLRFSNSYARKVTNEVIGRSIENLDTVERWIAPPDFISQLADGLDIHFEESLTEKEILEGGGPGSIISTIPMPALMKLVKWNEGYSPEKFNYRPITSITTRIVSPRVDVYQTIYYPSGEKYYRASITGDWLIVELIGGHGFLTQEDIEFIVIDVLNHFGIEEYDFEPPVIHYQKFGKIAPITESVRKQFILAMSDRHSIYSIGRYATWRNILLDDVVRDVQIVEQFIQQRDNYRFKLQGASLE